MNNQFLLQPIMDSTTGQAGILMIISSDNLFALRLLLTVVVVGLVWLYFRFRQIDQEPGCGSGCVCSRVTEQKSAWPGWRSLWRRTTPSRQDVMGYVQAPAQQSMTYLAPQQVICVRQPPPIVYMSEPAPRVTHLQAPPMPYLPSQHQAHLPPQHEAYWNEPYVTGQHAQPPMSYFLGPQTDFEESQPDYLPQQRVRYLQAPQIRNELRRRFEEEERNGRQR